MKFVPWEVYKAVSTGLKQIYGSVTEEDALLELDKFSERWDAKCPQISRSWQANWHNLNRLFGYPEDIRKAIYTTNAIESVNSVIRKASENASCSHQMTQPKRSSIWPSKKPLRNGPCPSETGNKH